jgi:hypothetical protein
MAFQDVADRWGTDGVPEIGEGSDDPVIAPRAVLAGHAHHEIFQRLVNAGTSDRRTRLCAVTRLGHKFAMPGEDGVRLGNRRDLCQGFPPELLTNLGKDQTIAITQRYTARYLLAEEPIFGHQARVAQVEFLIDGARDRC